VFEFSRRRIPSVLHSVEAFSPIATAAGRQAPVMSSLEASTRLATRSAGCIVRGLTCDRGITRLKMFGAGHHVMIKKLKLIYDRQSVGQSVLVSDAHLGPATNFSFSLKFPTDSCVFVILLFVTF
jgi:hypothetical protein